MGFRIFEKLERENWRLYLKIEKGKRWKENNHSLCMSLAGLFFSLLEASQSLCQPPLKCLSPSIVCHCLMSFLKRLANFLSDIVTSINFAFLPQWKLFLKTSASFLALWGLNCLECHLIYKLFCTWFHLKGAWASMRSISFIRRIYTSSKTVSGIRYYGVLRQVIDRVCWIIFQLSRFGGDRAQNPMTLLSRFWSQVGL